MGAGPSTPKSEIDVSTEAPMTSSVPCLSSHPNKEHLILAFFAGILLTLLLTTLILLIVKSCRKRRSSPQTLDAHPDPAAQHSSMPTESLTYASMSFKASPKRSHPTASHTANEDPVVYAQIKATNPPGQDQT